MSTRDLETRSSACRGHASALCAGADINHSINEKKARITARKTVVAGALIFAVTLVRFERLCRYSKGVGSLSRET